MDNSTLTPAQMPNRGGRPVRPYYGHHSPSPLTTLFRPRSECDTFAFHIEMYILAKHSKSSIWNWHLLPISARCRSSTWCRKGRGRQWPTMADDGWCAARRSFHQFSHNELPKCQTRAVFSRTGILDYKANALFSSALVLVKPLHHYDQGSSHPGELLLTTLGWFVCSFAGILDIKYQI